MTVMVLMTMMIRMGDGDDVVDDDGAGGDDA